MFDIDQLVLCQRGPDIKKDLPSVQISHTARDGNQQ